MAGDDEPGSRRGDDERGDREAARNRRRDRDAEAQARDLMRPGMGKVFKQIQDAQARAGRDVRDGAAGPSGSRRGARKKRD